MILFNWNNAQQFPYQAAQENHLGHLKIILCLPRHTKSDRERVHRQKHVFSEAPQVIFMQSAYYIYSDQLLRKISLWLTRRNFPLNIVITCSNRNLIINLSSQLSNTQHCVTFAVGYLSSVTMSYQHIIFIGEFDWKIQLDIIQYRDRLGDKVLAQLIICLWSYYYLDLFQKYLCTHEKIIILLSHLHKFLV